MLRAQNRAMCFVQLVSLMSFLGHPGDQHTLGAPQLPRASATPDALPLSAGRCRLFGVWRFGATNILMYLKYNTGERVMEEVLTEPKLELNWRRCVAAG